MGHTAHTVLLLDQDRPTSDLYQHMLRTRYQVHTCSDAASARELLRAVPVAALIVEPYLQRPEQGALLAELREASCNRALAIIVCSTLDPRHSGPERDQADIYLVKPVRPARLLELLATLLPEP